MAKNTYRSVKVDTLIWRLKFLAAFKFDDDLTYFRGEVPKEVIYVVEDDQGNPISYKMSTKDLAVMLIYSTDFKTKQDTLRIRQDRTRFEDRVNIEQQKDINHVTKYQNAYIGVKNRLAVFNSNNLKVTNVQILLWKQHNLWNLFRVTNMGDVKEAYIQGLMSLHQQQYDYLCNEVNNDGIQPYFSHELIGKFATNYIAAIDNGAAIYHEDVVLENVQYSIKSKNAEMPGFQQYIKTAEYINSENFSGSTEKNIGKINEYLKNNYEGATRNKIIDTAYSNTVSENIKDIISEVLSTTQY